METYAVTSLFRRKYGQRLPPKVSACAYGAHTLHMIGGRAFIAEPQPQPLKETR